MKIQEKRTTRLTPTATQLHITTYSATVALRDLGMGVEHGQPYDTPLDIGTPRPVAFKHLEGIEVLNGQLMTPWGNCLHSEQQIFADLIDINDIDASEQLLLRFWHGDRAWCQYHRQSRYDHNMDSWKDVIRTLSQDEELSYVVANLLFGRNSLRLRDFRYLCSERVSVATICSYHKELESI